VDIQVARCLSLFRRTVVTSPYFLVYALVNKLDFSSTRLILQLIQFMKKVIFGLLLVVTGMSSVQAQRNTVLLYGTVGFDNNKIGNATANSYNFSPGIGYQWNDNWTAGINLGLSDSKTNSSATTSSVAVGPFIRYAQPLAGIFAIYGQFNANVLSGTNYSGFQGTLFPAIGVNLKNSFALNFTFGSLSFTSQKFNGVAENSTNFHLAFGSGAGFGISKNFGLKK